MESQRIFRTAIGGFKKEDVLAYIANLSEMIDTLKAEQQREIDSYHASIEELKQQLEDSGSKAASAAAKSEENAHRAADAEAKNAALSAEYIAVRTDAEQRGQALAEMQERFARLEQENAALREKAAEYDSMTRQIGDVMLRARQDAEQITSNALKNADIARANLAKEVGDASKTVAAAAADFAAESGALREETAALLERIARASERLAGIDAALGNLHSNLAAGEEPGQENARI